MINQNNLNVLKLASKQDFKPEIASVLFTPEFTVATDSFHLIEMSMPKIEEDNLPGDAMEKFDPFMVRANDLKNLKIPKDKKNPICENAWVKEKEEDIVSIKDFIGCTETIHKYKMTPGEFPDYKQIIPEEGTIKARGAFNVELLIEGLEILKAMKLKFGRVEIKFYGDQKPMVITADNGEQKARYLIMPLTN